MVRGLSFQKGIIFIGKRYMACTYEEKGALTTSVKRLNTSAFLSIGKLVFFSMPKWFHFFLLTWVLAITIPIMLEYFDIASVKGLPPFTILYFFFGTHFWFPRQLRKYHGAEHKVFSYKGVVSTTNKGDIQKAEITNRYCSTNGVLLFFLLVPLITFLIVIVSNIHLQLAFEYGTYASVFVWPAATYWLNRMRETKIKRMILTMSYWLQKHLTTLEPDEHHMRTAIRSYRRLAFKEFPHKVRISKNRKEKRNMAIADITVIPLGGETASVSPVVAEIHRILKESKKDIKIELTPMSTIIEGDIDVLFEVIREVHEVPFKLGCKRVATNVRFDDRRDKPSSMEKKVDAVNRKLTHQETE
ncbi:MTH1187 family thiamine-binding protein [Bacillus shivajii]|uniref:MTH1187 family thiamine-binding protein n=1 Tax=Bacillus shivajii TaxID=1983719 RepID=UPI001CF97153|nr:MTH1187 family thiamine-binding protein [Bacillus shivajii]UCZ54564.1 MTH1187 family thiamine-binding protein [Bacillus shivajii]